uniref:Uncharacterized protein n=1 Tax=Paraburkholderia sprentiae WSM5005 TaxID=754502 RepID=A0A1I9YRI0_9BURK
MRAGANRAAEQRFGLTVSKESGHYIFRLWPRRLFVGHRGMPPSPDGIAPCGEPARRMAAVSCGLSQPAVRARAQPHA